MRPRPRFMAAAVAAVLTVITAALASPALAHAADGGTQLCRANNFSCTGGGFTGQQTWGYPRDSGGHNCTNYAAFRLSGNGAANPGNLGNAMDWDNNASAKGFAVDGTPVVGSIAQWEANTGHSSSYGHVAYVEEVGSGYIVISEDNYGLSGPGYTARYRINNGSSWWPSHFLHIKDVPPVGPVTPARRVNDLAWLQNDTLFTLDAGQSFNTVGQVTGFGRPVMAVPVDVDKDGREELAWFHSDPANPAIGTYYRVDLDGNAATHGTLRGPGVGTPGLALSGDFDGDGIRGEIAHYNAGKLYMFTGPGLSTTGEIPMWLPPVAGVIDYNHDRRDDLYMYDPASQQLHILISTGTTFSAVPGNPVRTGLGNPSWTGSGDFNGDGFRDEIAWQQGSTIFTLTGQGLGTTGTVGGIGTPAWAGTGRFDGDNRDDIFIYYGPQMEMHVITSTGTTFVSWGANPVRTGLGQPSFANNGEFNGR